MNAIATLETAEEKALAIVRAAQSKKGESFAVLDVEGHCSYTDVLVIVSAKTERQAIAIVDAVTRVMKSHGERPLSVEGQSEWIIADFGDVVLHAFVDEARAYYNLDGLWPNARRIPVPAPEGSEAALPTTPTALARRRVGGYR